MFSNSPERAHAFKNIIDAHKVVCPIRDGLGRLKIIVETKFPDETVKALQSVAEIKNSLIGEETRKILGDALYDKFFLDVCAPYGALMTDELEALHCAVKALVTIEAIHTAMKNNPDAEHILTQLAEITTTLSSVMR